MNPNSLWSRLASGLFGFLYAGIASISGIASL